MPVDLLSQLLSASIRVSGLALATLVGLRLFRIRSSAARHAVWTVVLLGMLLEIPLGVMAPAFPLRILPTPSYVPQPRAMAPTQIAAPITQTLTPASHMPKEPKSNWISASAVLTGIYLVISTLLLIRMVGSSWRLRRILRDSKPIPDLGPGIFESTVFVVPGSVGCFRAKIVLPQTWKEWNTAKLHAVLAHEKAHVQRRDWLIQLISHVNVCLFWFHPLAWWMEHELARLAEEACDDVALSETKDQEEYAAALVDFARVAAAHGGVLNWRVISMAKESNVKRRVNRILEAKLSCPKPFGRFAWVTLVACSLPVLYLSSAVKLATAEQASAHPAVEARQPILPKQKSSTKLIAQAMPLASPQQRQDPSIAMCILIDNSGSMRDKRAAVKVAALALVKASKPEDEVCIVDFNDEAYIDLAYTSDINKMEQALTHIESRGGTAMRDAIQTSIDHVEQTARRDRKVLMLITEGNDNASTVTQEQLLAKLKNSGVRVYCIGLMGEDDRRETRAARLALGQLAETSGGLVYYPRTLAEVESISPEIANEIRKQ